MKIILRACIEKSIDGNDDIVFYQSCACNSTAKFYALMGRSRLYVKDIPRVIAIGIEVQIVEVSGEDIYRISLALRNEKLSCKSSYVLSISEIRE
jgi:hypothetical protein